jgi:hypothetical protein
VEAVPTENVSGAGKEGPAVCGGAAAADMTMDAVIEPMKKGLSDQEAWETVREEWMFLPSEEDVPNLGESLDESPGGRKI